MSTYEQLKLSNQVCFNIYAASREITKIYRPYLQKIGVTYPQYLVLLVLWEEDGCTVKQLGEKLYLDSGTLTPLLKRMEESNFVIRERSKIDERKVIVRLTKEGEALKEEAKLIPEQLLVDLHLDPVQLEQILCQMRQIVAKP